MGHGTTFEKFLTSMHSPLNLQEVSEISKWVSVETSETPLDPPLVCIGTHYLILIATKIH